MIYLCAYRQMRRKKCEEGEMREMVIYISYIFAYIYAIYEEENKHMVKMTEENSNERNDKRRIINIDGRRRRHSRRHISPRSSISFWHLHMRLAPLLLFSISSWWRKWRNEINSSFAHHLILSTIYYIYTSACLYIYHCTKNENGSPRYMRARSRARRAITAKKMARQYAPYIALYITSLACHLLFFSLTPNIFISHNLYIYSIYLSFSSYILVAHIIYMPSCLNLSSINSFLSKR